MECAQAALEKAYGTQIADGLLGKMTKSLQNRAFSFMEQADETSPFSTLQNERTQTISLVLSYVEPDKAAGVISRLDEKRPVQAAESMDKITSVPPWSSRRKYTISSPALSPAPTSKWGVSTTWST